MKEIRTKKRRVVNRQTLLVTIDISKTTNMGSCRYPGGGDSKPFAFKNNMTGFRQLWERISQVRAASGAQQVVVGFESTGPYGEPLIHFLRSKPVHLVQVNPMHTKRVKELQGNSPNKTDRKDPRVIADIIELGHALSVIVPEGAAAELRRLTQARERSVQHRTAVKNQLQQLVFLVFPEFLPIMKGVESKSARYLLRHCLTPERIVRRGLNRLSSVLRRVSKGKLGRQRAESLVKAARDSVGIREGLEGLMFDIQGLLATLEVLEGTIQQAEERMRRHLKEVPASRFILSIKGMGEVTAAGLIGEVADFSRFRTIAEITKLAGLDLYEVSSGEHTGQRRISKRGRSVLRKLLYLATLNMVRRGGIFHEEYQRYRQRNIPALKGLIAITRKLLRLVFALVRDEREYQTDYAGRVPAQLRAA